jgi:hypothetical protein
MDGHTYTRGIIKMRLKRVPRSARGTEKVNGKNQQRKGMNPESAEEEES